MRRFASKGESGLKTCSNRVTSTDKPRHPSLAITSYQVVISSTTFGAERRGTQARKPILGAAKMSFKKSDMKKSEVLGIVEMYFDVLTIFFRSFMLVTPISSGFRKTCLKPSGSSGPLRVAAACCNQEAQN